MTTLKVGIVAEGKIDFKVISKLVFEIALEKNRPVECFPLQPTVDGTSGAFSEGGWRQVYQWCLRNDPNSRNRFFGGGLFSDPDSLSFDFIIVHLDGDLKSVFESNNIWQAVNVPDPRGVLNDTSSIFEYMKAAISIWLNLSTDETPHKHRNLQLPSIRSIESWVLASRKFKESDEILDPRLELAKLYFSVMRKSIPTDLKGKKKNPTYITKLLEEKFDLGEVEKNSFSFRKGLDEIQKHL